MKNDKLECVLLKQQVDDMRKEHQITINKIDDAVHRILKYTEANDIKEEEMNIIKNANNKILQNVKDIINVEVECITNKDMKSYMRLENIKAQYINLMSLLETIIH